MSRQIQISCCSGSSYENGDQCKRHTITYTHYREKSPVRPILASCSLFCSGLWLPCLSQRSSSYLNISVLKGFGSLLPKRGVNTIGTQVHFQGFFVVLEGSFLVVASMFQLAIQKHFWNFTVFHMDNMTGPLELTVDK